jgi:hypothetical protein
MRSRVRIDLNVRVRGNGTYTGLEDVFGPIAVGDIVEIFEPESSLAGPGRITDIDFETRLVYLTVEWASLRETDSKADDWMTQRGPVETWSAATPPLHVAATHGYYALKVTNQAVSASVRPGGPGARSQLITETAVA